MTETFPCGGCGSRFVLNEMRYCYPCRRDLCVTCRERHEGPHDEHVDCVQDWHRCAFR